MNVGPRLNRDLAFIAAGVIGAGALLGAAVGVGIDVLWHRHRRRA